MKKLFIVVLLIVGLLIPAVSAYEQTFTERNTIYGYGELSGTVYSRNFTSLLVKDILGLQGLDAYAYVNPIIDLTNSQKKYFTNNQYGHTSITGTIGADTIFTGLIAYNSNLYPDGSLKEVIFFIEFDNIDIKSYTGEQTITLNWNQDLVPPGQAQGSSYWDYLENANDRFTEYPIAIGATPSSYKYKFNGKHMYHGIDNWYNTVKITENDLDYTVDFIRGNNPSWAEINDADTGFLVYSSPYTTDDVTFKVKKLLITSGKINVSVVSHNGNAYNLFYPPSAPSEDSDITVYIKNSQTGALIANSNIVIDALVNGEYYPVANTTEPSGIFTITLQQTGGGQPNPDSYRLIATADGYNNPMPVINFTVTDSKKYIYCYLDPIAGGPENENNTFIDFYVRDLSANPVSAATVKFGKYTLITNSHGYTVFEVPKNTDYTYTVSKSGYGPVTGNANIGANDRYIINAVIGPAVTPTKPTPIPTSTSISPTPTMTAPNGEPVSNWLEWFAAHFGMILGGGVEIGKIFMWLCFTVPIGVYVGKEAKAGAAGFMAGGGIVTLFFVLIGWVPIWVVVLLALIIGLLYAKVFNSPDNGGGR